MPSEDLVPFSDLADSHPLTLNGDDTLIAVAQPDTSTETGYVSQTTTPNQLGAHIIQSQTHAGLKTQSKIVENAINSLVDDFTNINIIGSTNDTGSTINSGIFFYLNGVLVRATTAIADGDTLTSGTNYATVTAGGLNELVTPKLITPTYTTGVSYVSGGIYQIGKIVVVQLRLSLTSSFSGGADMVSGLPVPATSGSSYLRFWTINGTVSISADGVIGGYDVAAGTIIINGTYICS